MKDKYNKPIDVFAINMGFSKDKAIHAHEHNEIFLTLKGSGEQLTEDGLQKMREGDIFLFPPGQMHHGNGTPEGGCVGGVIYVHDYIFEGKSKWETEAGAVLKMLSKGTKNGNNKIRINPHGREKLFRIFHVMLNEQRSKKPGYKSQLNSMMHQLMITILRNSQLEIESISLNEKSIIREKINDVLQFLETHYMQHLNIEQIAKTAGMSRSYFHANFKKATGKTFVDYLNNIRVNSSEKLLQTATFDIGTVASRTGFTSVSHFYKVFKESTGTTPVKFQKKHKADN